jgi:hypothetical protein
MNFYVIKPTEGLRFGRKWAYGESEEPVFRGDCEYCPVCSGPVSGLRWLPPHQISLSSAKPEKWGDFVWGSYFSLVVSSRFKEIYEREGLSGIETISDPMEVVRLGRLKKGAFPIQPPQLHLIHVPWGGANQDDSASGLVHEQPKAIRCSYCRVGVSYRKQERIIIEESSWNGQDIFTPRNAPVSFVVSERFKQVVEAYKLTNLWLIPTEKYAYDERRPLSVGLSWYVKE